LHCTGKGSFQQEERSHVWIPQPPAEKKTHGPSQIIRMEYSETWTLQKSDIRKTEAFEM